MKKLLVLLLTMANAAAIETEPRTFKAADGTEVLYRYAAPAKIKDGEKVPLVLFLHGSGERGDNNKAQLKHGAKDILKNAEQLDDPVFLIAPQCPNGRWWAEPQEDRKRLADAKGPNALLDALLELVDQTASEQAVDPDRIYITGLSMGGFGTWSVLARKPEVFAAAIPICGAGDPETVGAFKDLPIRIFHGANDDVVPPAGSQLMFDALKQAGSDAKLTLYPGVGHNSWTRTYNDKEVIRWLLAQTRSD
jgi:predicted peptidase